VREEVISHVQVYEPIEERRCALRAEVQLPARLSELPEPGAFPGDEELLEPLYGRVENLSLSGLLVSSPQPVCPGRRVIVVLQHRDQHIPLRGRVRRLSRRGARGYLMGVELARVKPGARRLILRLVDACRVHPEWN
jgi:hypothetical protein